jgi:hypothetical protein
VTTRRHLVIPDVQAKDDVPLEHLTWCGEYIVKMKPDVVVQIGDFADMPSLSSYDAKGSKSYEGKRYKADIKAAKRAMGMLLQPLREYQKWTQASHKPRYEPRLVLTLGNHEDRITRAIESDPNHLEGLIALEDLGYAEAGWEVHPYLKPVEIDGIVYNHYFPTGQMGHPCGTARSILNKYHMSCFAGHQQGRDIAYARRADGKTITAIIAGSFYQHEEQYLNPITNNHWRGIYVLHEVSDGAFDEMPVSLNYLRSRYGKEGE